MLGAAADDDGQAAQLGTARLLDGGEEGVHVDVEDGPGCEANICSSVPGSRTDDNVFGAVSGAGVQRLRRPKSTVHMSVPVSPLKLPRAQPTPTSRQRGSRMLRRWADECIHALNTALQAVEPLAQPMISPTDQLR